MSDKNSANLPKIIHLEPKKVHDLLIECFAKANLLENEHKLVKNFATKLLARLKEDEEITQYLIHLGRSDYQNYLRDLYARVLKMIDIGNEKSIFGFSSEHIMPLLMYLDKRDAIINLILAEPQPPAGNKVQEKKAAAGNSVFKVQVLYSKKSYGLLSLLRNPDKGMVHLYENGDCIFEGEEHLYLKFGELKRIELHKMYGDPFPWIKLTYEKDSTSYIAYFAQVETVEGDLKMADPETVFHIFRHRLIPT